MTRPAHKPTKKTKEMVSTLAKAGYTHDDIAEAIGICDETLRKYYRAELDRGKWSVTQKAVGVLFKKIEEEDWQAVRFWLSTRAGFVSQVGHNAGSESPPGVALVPMIVPLDEWEDEAE